MEITLMVLRVVHFCVMMFCFWWFVVAILAWIQGVIAFIAQIYLFKKGDMHGGNVYSLATSLCFFLILFYLY